MTSFMGRSTEQYALLVDLDVKYSLISGEYPSWSRWHEANGSTTSQRLNPLGATSGGVEITPLVFMQALACEFTP